MQRGHVTTAASVQYDSAAPHELPFHVAGLAGRDIFSYAFNMLEGIQPAPGQIWDTLISIQDFPYHVQLYQGTKIDFSKRKWIIVTPIDGVPIPETWIQTAKDHADGILVISEFGVKALADRGVKAHLLEPGINRNEFYPAEREERDNLRQLANLPKDAFVWGMMAMNQGRKNIPGTVIAFREFACNKEAYLVLDMERVSAGGWDLVQLMGDLDVPLERIRFKDDLIKAGLGSLRDRYCLLDFHSVLAFREGFGLPHIEAMACKIPTAAQDYCSGTEICQDGRGILVPVLPYTTYGTWGGAMDKHPDIPWLADRVNDLYKRPGELAAIAEEGFRWAIRRTWDRAADQVEEVIREVHGEDYHLGPFQRPAPVNPEATGTNSGSASGESALPPGAPSSDLSSSLQPRAGDQEMHGSIREDRSAITADGGFDSGGRSQPGGKLQHPVPGPSFTSDSAPDKPGELRSEPEQGDEAGGPFSATGGIR